MSSWRQQAVIESPLEDVWELVRDPNRYPEWASEIVEVTGLPTVEADASFQQLTEDPDEPSGAHLVNFKIEDVDDEVHRIQFRCVDSRTYLRCAVTEAQGNTFVDMETGVDQGDAEADTGEKTRDFFIRLGHKMLDGLRRTTGSRSG